MRECESSERECVCVCVCVREWEREWEWERTVERVRQAKAWLFLLFLFCQFFSQVVVAAAVVVCYFQTDLKMLKKTLRAELKLDFFSERDYLQISLSTMSFKVAWANSLKSQLSKVSMVEKWPGLVRLHKHFLSLSLRIMEKVIEWPGVRLILYKRLFKWFFLR